MANLRESDITLEMAQKAVSGYDGSLDGVDQWGDFVYRMTVGANTVVEVKSKYLDSFITRSAEMNNLYGSDQSIGDAIWAVLNMDDSGSVRRLLMKSGIAEHRAVNWENSYLATLDSLKEISVSPVLS